MSRVPAASGLIGTYTPAPLVIASLNKQLKVFDWGWGAVDFAKPGAVEITDYLKSQGVKLTTTENQGGHDWRTWREDLHRFAQMIFR